ncbi:MULTISPECIES: Na+/H+ antiporter family protein [Anoxybacillus]|uniref:Na+/H+ antiporter family protein n=1 Tax=Anoxybacillus TaxID=150247 RepID=UPI000385B1AC|nr:MULTISPECIES: Na+/H+ antiporter family protein [Anoxybacillus]EPZ39322.1 permease [Anoxybacillus ayderensis]KHF28140.1 Na+/H+ antiporter family protein [Anoxybacillus sp. BCO1]NNU97323.1 Na+/H+ antiporter family protein [Anoxybacillus sp. EFIL]OSX53416.1 sodium:proton antiporter [Anoxybacillus ayderensis]
MNAVVISVLIMLILSLLRMNVVFSLLIASLVGGLIGNLSLSKTVEVFSEGLGNSAEVALSYALLGGFAIAISKTGLPNAIVRMIIKMVGKQGESKRKQYSKALVLLVILFMSCFSQNLIPIHIAFIPILIPPLLHILNELHVDRRLVASIITFGLITPYMWLPTGFGAIFHDIVQSNMAQSGLVVAKSDIPKAMFFPSLGMIVGLLLAFFTYRKPRTYKQIQIESQETQSFQQRGVWFAIVAVITALTVQLVLDSMIFGAFAGIVVIYLSGCIRLTEGDRLLTEGMRMMAFIGFVMLSASGFANVLKQTGHIEKLVEQAASLIGHNTALGALLMLIVGLLVTMGIGSSFSTVPIIATIFVPLCIKLGLSPMATIAIIGAAGALGDAGSPASDSTLGPTSGLNVDGQHHHIWDTCVPTFIHYNIPVIIFAWIAAMIL